MAESDLIQTGIYGLDEIFLGGILKGNLILVEGAAGVGKTLMGLEFIYRGITKHDEPGIIVVFETSPMKLIRDAAGFGWDLDELQQRNKLKTIFTSAKVLDQELRSPDSLLLETAVEIGAHHHPPHGDGEEEMGQPQREIVDHRRAAVLTPMLSGELMRTSDFARIISALTPIG